MTPMDARLWSAESVISQLGSAMRVGDLQRAYAYFTPKGRAAIEPILSEMNRSQLEAAAKRLYVRMPAQPTSRAGEYVVTLTDGRNVSAVRDERTGEWRIEALPLPR